MSNQVSSELEQSVKEWIVSNPDGAAKLISNILMSAGNKLEVMELEKAYKEECTK